jgi:uncharacterized protein YndB with AHSA1/START domain
MKGFWPSERDRSGVVKQVYTNRTGRNIFFCACININQKEREYMIQFIGATVSATIPASPDQLWPIISDVTRHPELAGSGEVVQTELLTPGPIRVGARFQSQQNMRGMRYSTVSHVVACEPPHHLAWRIGVPGSPAFGQVWQFELKPQGTGTQVEHGVALVYALPQVPPFTMVNNVVARGEVGAMTPTLVNLAKLAGVEPPTTIDSRLRPPESAVALLPPVLLLAQGGLWAAGGAVLLAQLLARRPRSN